MLNTDRTAAEEAICNGHKVIYQLTLACGCRAYRSFSIDEISTPLWDLWIDSPFPPGLPKAGDMIEWDGSHAPNAWPSGHPSPQRVVAVKMFDHLLNDAPPLHKLRAWEHDQEREAAMLVKRWGDLAYEQGSLFG